jgi:2-polyprenyl-3-methyl-5-hydroxy-6-metoxy-1,4-benzoquinol methylase
MALPYNLKAFPYSSHDWIVKILSREKRPLRILDVGTATGYLGMLLSGQGHRVVGVESDAEAAAEARPYYDQLSVADLEQFEFPERGKFDWVLFADVLEHLRDPAKVLARAASCLNPTGKVLISVPNVAHFAIRFSLLAGRFDYAERGILDRTHLRFFTLRSLEEMVERAGYRIREVEATPLPVQLVFPFTRAKAFAPLHQAHYALARLHKRLFAYQFVMTAVPEHPRSAPAGMPVSR